MKIPIKNPIPENRHKYVCVTNTTHDLLNLIKAETGQSKRRIVHLLAIDYAEKNHGKEYKEIAKRWEERND